MNIIIAPNAFKNCLNARTVAEAIEKGLLYSSLDAKIIKFPIGDGGDGTGQLIIEQCNGTFVYEEVLDPLQRPINAGYGIIQNGNIAVIEMANASGIRLLGDEKKNPLLATSYGTGQLIKSALNKGVKKIIITMGGSATVDGGMGILSALGYRFLNSNGEEIGLAPENLLSLSLIDDRKVDNRLKDIAVEVFCDVDNHLLGSYGATAVFGPQKGASEGDVVTLENALIKLCEQIKKQFGKDISAIRGGGAAGGAAAGISGLLNAKLLNGIEAYLTITGFSKYLEQSDLLITGEGSLDKQTLQGKGPVGIAKQAKEKGLTVIGLAGKIPLELDSQLYEYFDIILAVGNEPASLEVNIANTEMNLIRIGKQIGELLACQIKNTI